LELALSIVVNGAIVFFSLREYPELRIHLTRPASDKLRLLWEFSLYIFIINTSLELIYRTDALIVGKIFSTDAVTVYVIGGSLIEYFRQLLSSMTSTFTPFASRIAAQNQPTQLQELLIGGTTVTFLIGLPIAVVLFIRGSTFIHLWMGESYRLASGSILCVLLIAQFFAMGNMTSWGIAYGLGKYKPVAAVVAVEGVLNLGLSTFLALRIGIEGVAWGTVIPSLFTHVLFWPLYVSRLVNLPLWSYVRQAWIKPYIAMMPFAVACYVVEHHWHASSLFVFFLQTFVLLPLLIGGIALCFWRQVVDRLRTYPFDTLRIFPSTTTR
jgi:O-antigen/teichoic acid export membrane protein